jgi:hypothetical protein
VIGEQRQRESERVQRIQQTNSNCIKNRTNIKSKAGKMKHFSAFKPETAVKLMALKSFIASIGLLIRFTPGLCFCVRNQKNIHHKTSSNRQDINQ